MDGSAWLLLILVLLILAILIWWWARQRLGQEETPLKTTAPGGATVEPMSTGATRAADTTGMAQSLGTKAEPPMPAAPPKPDDLVIIEGIGPKIASILKDAGIVTFAQLAASDVGKLEEILKANGLQFADPTTWPEQSRLAAEGKMAELQAFQDSLKGGRRK
jgi:predicted flap endonuclease-1-like 5' DNA nuclease